MPRTLRTVTALSVVALCSAAVAGEARSRMVSRHREPIHVQTVTMGAGEIGFALQDPPLGSTRAPAATPIPASLAGSTVAALADGALVIDADSGKLLRVDRTNTVVATLDVGREASQLVVDAANDRAFVVDRSHDQLLVVSLDAGSLRKADAIRTAAEPFGVALTPDGSTLLVTHVADQRLTAFDTGSGFEKWSIELGPEPRGVSISPNGDEALVTFLTTGVVGRVALGGVGGQPKLSFVSLDPAGANATAGGGFMEFAGQQPFRGMHGGAPNTAATTNPDRGKSFVRNTFATAYVGNGVAVVPHQISTPHLATSDFEAPSGGYGGGNGFTAPVSHRLAFLDLPDAGESRGVRTAMATTSLHQPRAMAYDGGSDTLYVAGYGSDDVVAIAEVSQSSVHLGWQRSVADATGSCAPDGLAVDQDTGELLVFCSLTRKLVRMGTGPDTDVAHSGELAKSNLSAAELRGKKMFRQGRSPMLSSAGAMACASCHAEGRSDGLTWFLQGNILQTPFLAGRLVDTHPFKWDGQDANLTVSLTGTVKRLGGTGISNGDADDLQAFLTALPRPRTPTVEDVGAVTRGKELFESSTTGCLNCHDGAMSTDGKRHDLATDLASVDTPSLIGLAHSAPYYHDGSSTSLESLLRNNGSIHAMGRTSRLEDAQISDLVAYLQTL